MKTYYHFTKETLRNGSPIPPIGEWLTFTGPVAICRSGLHASQTPYDALQYAPGQMLHRVELEEIQEEHADKVVARRRKIVATIDATNLLRTFARKQALTVIHLWDCPAITRQYLETGDDSLRSAAQSAARSAADAADAAQSAADAADAARSAADAADAARSAAQSAARSAAYAARSAAQSAAWSVADAARSAAQSAARSAADAAYAAWSAADASAAAWSTARSAARSAADAAWSAAWSAAAEMFNTMAQAEYNAAVKAAETNF